MKGSFKPFNINDIFEIQRLELALESAGIGTWELDGQTNQIRWRHRAKNLFDFHGENFINLPALLDLIALQVRDAFRNEISNVCTSQQAASFSLELRTHQNKEGNFRWLLCKGQSHLDATGQHTRILGTFIDITKELESRRLLSEKQKNASSFQTIVDQAPMAIGILKGHDFVIELGTEKIFEVWGKPSSITGMKLSDALPEI